MAARSKRTDPRRERIYSWLLVPAAVLVTIGFAESFFALNRWLKFLPPIPPRWNVHFREPVEKGGLDSRLARIIAKFPVHSRSPEADSVPLAEVVETREVPRALWPAGATRSREILYRQASGRILLRTTVSRDAQGRRLTFDPSSGSGTRRSLTFLGCSFTFGAGVDDFQTLPSQMAALLPRFRAYNLGVSGGSVTDAIQILNEGKLTRGIEPGGIAFFTFINDHIFRTAGTMRILNRGKDQKKLPLYRLVDGRPEVQGSFIQAAPLRTALAPWVSLSPLLNYLNIDFPIVQDSDILLTAKLLAEARRLTKEKLGARELYVILYSGSQLFGKRLVPKLEQEGVPVFDYSDVPLDMLLGGRDYARAAGHPSAQAHELTAKILIADLKDRGVLK